MDQIGQVVELQGKSAVVRVRRTSACGENCASCGGGCTPTSTTLKAVNGLNAKVGDMVKVEMSSGAFVLLAFIGYILPILIAIAAYMVARQLSSDTIVADISAVVALVLTLVVFFVVDKLPKKSTRFSSRIIRILR
ncbi:MAG: SoxR reducing system RseC family protein [Oscillospiraceae bacterium]|nr:SoxR reducing system RseC family protein [Oscillospiraceae bacterium]